MLDSIFLQAQDAVSLSVGTMLLCCGVSIVLGFAIAAAYMVSSEKYSKNFVISLVILPILVQVVITIVNGNLGTGVAIVGAFSLVRFRSFPGNSKDITAVFFSMAVGLATGMGYIGYAFIFTVIVAVVFVILNKAGFGEKKETAKHLKITIPENLNYMNLFDDIFDKYLIEYKRGKVKTTNLGSMFEISYLIKQKDENDEKKMIDEIRERNGNLTIVCNKVSETSDEL